MALRGNIGEQHLCWYLISRNAAIPGLAFFIVFFIGKDTPGCPLGSFIAFVLRFTGLEGRSQEESGSGEEESEGGGAADDSKGEEDCRKFEEKEEGGGGGEY